ncbi:MAG: LuxR C-terminal-related transcriptional regulator [Xanthobacteraceae bacterium]|nr:LuxR C-terminal-related transcriptional regulator [Xanthobacteraceae bacterium]
MARPPGMRGWSGDEAKLLDLVGAMYDAALAPQELPRVLSRLARLCGGIWTPLSVIPIAHQGSTLTVQNADVDPGFLTFFHQNYTTPDRNPSIPRIMAMPQGRVVLREEHYSDAEWERIDMYRDVYVPIGGYASLGAPLLKTQDYFALVGMVRAKSKGEYESRELKLLERAIPHLQRMMQILLRLDALEARQATDEALWDRLPFGVFILDDTGRILWGNRMGESILTENDGLASRGDQLFASASDQNTALHRLIGEAALTRTGRGLSAGGALALSRPSARQPLAVLVAPFAAAQVAQLMPGRHSAVVVMVSDPAAKPQAAPQLLSALYGLTRREAALVSLLLEGLDLRDAAERLGLAMNTVRTHLRAVFHKTGTRRQSELIGLLSRSIAMLGRAD